MGIWAVFRNGPFVPKNIIWKRQWTGMSSESSSDRLTKNKLEGWASFSSRWKQKNIFLIKSTKRTCLFFAFLFRICYSKCMSGHCHSSHVSTCNLCCLSPLLLVYLHVPSLLGRVHCYHWAVIRSISSLKSGKVLVTLTGRIHSRFMTLKPIFQILLWPYMHTWAVFVGKKLEKGVLYFQSYVGFSYRV